MEQSPKRLEENLANLSNKMAILKNFRDEMARKKPQQMALWLENVSSKVEEFDVLANKIRDLNNGGAVKIRNTLNREVLEVLRMVNLLEKLGNDLSNTIEKLFCGLTEGNPRRFSHANLKAYTSNFSTIIDMHLNGNVYKGQFSNGTQVIVKVLTDKDAVEKIFMAEMNTMFKTSHRNLVKLYGFCFEDSMKALIFEYMENGSLDKVLFENRHNLKWEELYCIAVETAKGLSYLHDGCDEEIIHRSLKTSNVLLGSNFSPMVTNFGVTKLMNRDLSHFSLSTVRGASSYSAPEMSTKAAHVNSKCDVFSFGMILFEVLGRRNNIQTKAWFPKQVWDMFERREVDKLMKECRITEEDREKAMLLAVVALWCIQYSSENRPYMSTVVKMLQKEIQVMTPPNPFFPFTQVHPYQEAVCPAFGPN